MNITTNHYEFLLKINMISNRIFRYCRQ